MKRTKLFGTLAAVGVAALLLAACGNHSAQSMDHKTASSSSMTKVMNTSDDMSTYTGNFQGDNHMKVSGKVTIKDGKLMLTDFSTSAGPNLHVYLAKGTDPKTGVDLAPISLTAKSQTFDLKGTNVKKYSDVLIYCDKAHALFGHAPIATGDDATTTNTAATLAGSFKGQNGKKVSGDVTVSAKEIDLSNFKTVAGPDLHIYLSKDGSVDNGAVNLGKISLTDANQKIKVPAGTNINDFKQVLIHCDEAHVTFGAADVK